MKKKLLVVIGLMLLLSLAVFGCGQPAKTPAEETGEPSAEGETEVYKIGIVQIAEHPALDAAREGFIAALNAEGFIDGENISLNFQSAQNEQAVALTIAEGFVSDNVDLILAIATPAAQAAATATKEIPILITAVTDPVAAELVESMEKPNTNVTGTTDMNPIKEQLELILELVPGAEKIGILYNSGEINSVVQVDIAKQVASELGIGLEEAIATNTGEVTSAAEALLGKVDAFYVPTDNTIVDAISSVIRVAEEYKIPLIAAESESVKNGALATVGITYYGLGEQTGYMAAEILRGADPSTMSIQGSTEYTFTVNTTAAKNMGVELPDNILEQAEIIE